MAFNQPTCWGRYFQAVLLVFLVVACDRPDHTAAGDNDLLGADSTKKEIAITQHPRQTMSGRPLKPHPAVQLSAGSGAPPAGVAVRVTPTPGQFEPSSVTEVLTDAEGRAVFEKLILTQAETIYRLRFSADGYEPVTSKQFNIVFGPPRKMSLLSEPTNSRAGQPVGGGVAVLLTDEAGNPVPNVNVRVAAHPEGNVIGSGQTIVPTDSRGIAAFSDLVIAGPTAVCQLVFECLAAGVNPVTTASFAVESAR